MVQAVDLGAGGDDYFLVLGQFGHDDVGLPNRRHTVDFLDLGFGGGRIHGDGVDTKSRYVYVAVEHAAEYVAAVAVVHPAREGAAKDLSVAAVFHSTLEDAVHDGVAICHFFLKAAVLYGAFVCHAARKGAVLDGVSVCHFSIEGAVLDVAAVCYCSIEGSARDFSSGVVCHFLLKAAVLYGAFVCHTARKGAAGNFCPRRLNLNLTLYRLCGTEIKRSTRQSQFLSVFIVTPAGATARDFALVGSLRVAALHDEVGAGDRSVQHHVLVRHGEGHDLIVAAVAALAVAIADGLAVQAEDFGVGNDGHGGAFVGVEVPCRVGRHGSRCFIHYLQWGFAVHLAHTAIRYGDVVGFGGQRRLAVEYAVVYVAGVLRQARREGTAIDISFDISLAVYHSSLEGAVHDGAFVCHCAIEGSTRDFSVAEVGHCCIEGSVRDFSVDVVGHCSIEGAVRDCSADAVYHCPLKFAARNRSLVVSHCSIEGAAGNFCPQRLNLNLI